MSAKRPTPPVASTRADPVAGRESANQRTPTLADLVARAGAWVWLLGGGVSLALFGLVAAQLDATVVSAASSDFWLFFVAAVALFVVDHFVSSLRMQWMVGGRGGLAPAMRVTAWHGIWVAALPMRLGELAYVAAIQHVYGWSFATALACAAVQRLLDMAVVAAFLLLTMPAAFGLYADQPASLAFAATAGLLLVSVPFATVATAHIWLRAVNACLVSGRMRRRRRRLVRSLSRVRRWIADVQGRRVLRRCALLTVLVWTTTMAGCWLLGQAAGLQVSLSELGFATAAGMVFGALPAPTIGGFGMLEAGFTGVVAWLGAPAATAAFAALAIRFASLTATGVFWLIATAATAATSMLGAGRHTG